MYSLFNKKTVTFLILILLTLSIFSQPKDVKKANQETIAKIETAFIYNFIKNVTWPNESQFQEFRIGVMSSENLAQQLNTFSKLKKFKDKIQEKLNPTRDVLMTMATES